MSGTISRLTACEVRKRLLLAESEVNRIQLLHECECLRAEAHEITVQMKKVYDSVASVASMGMAGYNAFKDLREERKEGKSSWLSTVINGVRIGASLWSTYRSRPRE